MAAAELERRKLALGNQYDVPDHDRQHEQKTDVSLLPFSDLQSLLPPSPRTPFMLPSPLSSSPSPSYDSKANLEHEFDHAYAHDEHISPSNPHFLHNSFIDCAAFESSSRSYLQFQRMKYFTCDELEEDVDFALLVTNCSDDRVNGLYTLNGYRNGYVKYVECVNHEAVIYCNPKRGWTISLNRAVKYYSFPLFSRVPTVVDCHRQHIEWYSQAMHEESGGLPQVKSARVMGAYLLDLLFVGYARDAAHLLPCRATAIALMWCNKISIDVVNILTSYFIECRHDKCATCSKICSDLVLNGFKYLCRDCSGHAVFNLSYCDTF
eukprot:CAMPEP_0202694722 /NCGR_PEP_ID=MMETSP1385-20130828/8516_1 /ASSEMBLY_ACC=CAM_ASM_000861 /TAXON_ID=933848 /ORGANISM="Elphidium margaritaceum" /LENGTH=321 /DNA_ID=CAMNT_0049350621 /DNA_START=39 /DNA_END=1004 /DNA_ORIENTATION=+